VNQVEPVAADEEDLMAERDPDEQAQSAQPLEDAEPRVDTAAEDAARPATPTSEAPETPADATGAEASAEAEVLSESAPEPVAPAAEEPETGSPELPASAEEPPAEAAVTAERSESMASAEPALEMGESEAPEAAAEDRGEDQAEQESGHAPTAATAEAEIVTAEDQGEEQAAGESGVAPSAPTAEAETAAAELPSEAAWYVIHCYSGYENKVRHNLEQRIETMGMKDKIFDVVIPTQEEIEVKEGKRRTVERHIFPGYVLVQMALSEESWYVVRNTPGVTGFVGMGNLPTALRPEEVAQIVKRMEAEAPTVKVSFKVGERVRIIDGPFNDFRGTVSDIDMERTKVRVMVSFFGRETPVELDFLQVEKS
jgi:transcriptional antiterminator NusG